MLCERGPGPQERAPTYRLDPVAAAHRAESTVPFTRPQKAIETSLPASSAPSPSGPPRKRQPKTLTGFDIPPRRRSWITYVAVPRDKWRRGKIAAGRLVDWWIDADDDARLLVNADVTTDDRQLSSGELTRLIVIDQLQVRLQ
jgi:hypothetical protein